MTDPASKRCFIAMPITTHAHEAALYLDDAHWKHVMEHLFIPAIEAAGMEPVRPTSQGAAMIHADIVKNLETSDMTLCDLSGGNVNVFFELGIRVSLDKPMTLVRDETEPPPFDLSGVNVHQYESAMRTWQTDTEIERLTKHITACVTSCNGTNPLWKQYGLTKRAEESDPNASPLEATVLLLADKVDILTSLATRDTSFATPTISSRSPEDLARGIESWARRNKLPLKAEPSSQHPGTITITATKEVLDSEELDQRLRDWSEKFGVNFDSLIMLK